MNFVSKKQKATVHEIHLANVHLVPMVYQTLHFTGGSSIKLSSK